MYPLPEELQQAIEKEMKGLHFHDVLEAREQLTYLYRNRQPDKREFMTTNIQRCAYAAARLPATYAVIRHVLNEVALRLPNIPISSLLDLGAGPGSVMWAACQTFSSIERITLAEKDVDLIALGKRLALHSHDSAIRRANWQIHDLEKLPDVNGFIPHDLVVLSYSIGELSPEAMLPLISACWNAANQVLIVIEPGTPLGFERIRAIRQQLIALKGQMIAPCPHSQACPITGSDWCHFSERIERSSLHRRLKEGVLSYEDEKFSFVAFSKIPCIPANNRVLRHPLKRSGHVVLNLCTPTGLKQTTVSKKSSEAYKHARKLEWGDTYTFNE